MTTKTESSQFDALLEELDLAKAARGGAPIKGSKATVVTNKNDEVDPDADEGDDDGPNEEDDEDEDEEEETDPDLGKSFVLTLEDGTQVPAIDGAGLIKSLIGRVEVLEGALKATIGAVKERDGLIKSLQGDVGRLGNAGRGRRAVVTVAEKSVVTAEMKQGLAPGDFLAKSMEAMAEGRLSGTDMARIEAYLNRGQQPPSDIIAKVLKA